MTTDLRPHTPTTYQIRLRGHLGAQWAEWFDGMNVSLEENGETRLTGVLADQAALFGVLKKVRDLGMPLISVTPLEDDPSIPGRVQPDEPEDGQS
jgi:hypothetical protein